MKVTAVPKGAGVQQTVNPNSGSSASSDKIARAKAIVTGQAPPAAAQDSRSAETSARPQPRTIKMKTNATPAGREWAQPETAAPAQAASEPHILDNAEPVTTTQEAPKPLDPQVAAVLKQRRALQAEKSAFEAEKQAFAQKAQPPKDVQDLLERMKARPLGFMIENGIATYDQLTQEVMRDMEGGTPALTKVEAELRSEIKGLKEALDQQTKTQNDAWTQQQENALNEMQAQADQIIASDDAYQSIREANANQDVKELIKAVLIDEKKTLSVKEALDIIENDLIDEGLKFARLKKVQERVNPAPPPQKIQPTETQDGVRRQTMRTLTNRDIVTSIPSRRERAMAAAQGKKLG